MATPNTKALKAEAQNEDVTFSYQGFEFTVSKDVLKDLDVVEGFEEGKVIGPCKKILGDRQWKLFRSTGGNVDDLGKLVEALFDAVGVEPGE